MTQNERIPPQFQGDCEGQRPATTKPDGMWDVEPSGVPWPHRRPHPQAAPTVPSDNPAGGEGIMAQPERVDMLVLGSGAAGKLLAGHRAHAGSRTAVVERQLIGG